MGGIPKMSYSDEEGSSYSNTVLQYLEKEKIEIPRTRGMPLSPRDLTGHIKICILSQLKQLKKGYVGTFYSG